MDDRVKEEYEKILTRSIIKHGSLVRVDASTFGWMDQDGQGYDFRKPRHSSWCEIVKTGQVEEDATWYEFAGTFADSHYKHGMEVHGVTCDCGQIKDRTFRWDAPVGEAIKVVLEELLEERVKDEVVPE